MKLEILKNKNILLLLSASIAIYKSLELISELKKIGANIRVVMSEESKKFITPMCVEALTHTQVLHKDSENWIDSGDVSCNHIAYAKWADIALVAPASANSIAKLANGIADNLLLSTFLALNTKRLIAPAMNTAMYESKQIQNKLKEIQDLGIEIIEPRVSLLACDTYGKGAMAESDEIIFKLSKAYMQNQFWKDKNVLISGGGSKESIDNVRFLSNHSSGLQASLLAIALYVLGAKVKFVSSVFPIKLPLDIECFKVNSAKEYLENIQKYCPQKGFMFMAAAISDYSPKNPKNYKMKKEEIGDYLNIECEKNPDILSLIEYKDLFKVGFKAEYDENKAQVIAQKMLLSQKDGGKNCDMVCLNLINTHSPFGSYDNEMEFFMKGSSKKNIISQKTGFKNKLQIAFDMAYFIQKHVE